MADCLLRAPITSDRIQLPILQVHEFTNALKCTADHLQQLWEKTLQYDTPALLKHTIQAGWPEKTQQVPPEIQPYWTFWGELTIEDGLVLKNTSIIIPTSERNDLLAMMIYCNTPLGPNQKSPLEILHGRQVHSDFPMANAALQAKVLLMKHSSQQRISTKLMKTSWSKDKL